MTFLMVLFLLFLLFILALEIHNLNLLQLLTYYLNRDDVRNQILWRVISFNQKQLANSHIIPNIPIIQSPQQIKFQQYNLLLLILLNN